MFAACQSCIMHTPHRKIKHQRMDTFALPPLALIFHNAADITPMFEARCRKWSGQAARKIISRAWAFFPFFFLSSSSFQGTSMTRRTPKHLQSCLLYCVAYCTVSVFCCVQVCIPTYKGARMTWGRLYRDDPTQSRGQYGGDHGKLPRAENKDFTHSAFDTPLQ